MAMNEFITQIYREFLTWKVEIIHIDRVNNTVRVADYGSGDLIETRADIAEFFLKYAEKK